MEEKCKRNLGRKIGKKLYFTNEEKREIINEYLNSDKTKQDIYEKYTGYKHEHGKLLKWMRKLEIEDKSRKILTFNDMKNKKGSKDKGSDSFDKEVLEKRIKELEEQLEAAEMKAIAYSTMVDIAEKELKIPIRKKYDTKPSKK